MEGALGIFSTLFKWGHNRHYTRGMTHFNRGEFEAAVACFEAALKDVRVADDPDRSLAACYAAEARAQMGLACFHAGDDARAEAAFSRVLAETPAFPDLRYYRARIRHRSGRLEEAIEDLEIALEQHPRFMDAWLLLAVCRGLSHQPGLAGQALTEALALGLQLPDWAGAARIREWGLTEWESLLGAAPGPVSRGPAPFERALERYDAGDLEGAAALLAEAVRERPAYADLRCRLAGVLLEAGRVEEALPELDQALKLNPRYLEARLLAARAHLERDQAALAIEHVRAALLAHPGYPDLHFWHGLALFRAGRLAEAAAALERAVGYNRQFARAHRLLGLVHHALGRPEEALRALRRGMTRDREVPEIALVSAPLLAALGDPAAAESELERAVARCPDYPDLHVALARCRQARGDLAGARTALEAALRLKPHYVRARYELARLELADGRPDSAEQLLEPVVAAMRDWADAQALLGRARMLKGDAPGAETALRAALLLNPSFGSARADLGWALLAQGRTAEADEAFARALEIDPLHALPRQQLAWRALLAHRGSGGWRERRAAVRGAAGSRTWATRGRSIGQRGTGRETGPACPVQMDFPVDGSTRCPVRTSRRCSSRAWTR